MKSRHGFTLIELLIVVLIIAILAAIAVPNFLEFQTRAKVSRAMTDMRSLAIAIEAYTVDWDVPPQDGQVPPDTFAWCTNLIKVTTPIAYITTLFDDVFATDEAIHDAAPSCEYYWYVRKDGYGTYRYGGDGRGNRGKPANTPGKRLFGPPRDDLDWAIISPAPDARWEWDKSGSDHFGDVLYYDPTNGTISPGDIYYFGSGAGLNPEPVLET